MAPVSGVYRSCSVLNYDSGFRDVTTSDLWTTISFSQHRKDRSKGEINIVLHSIADLPKEPFWLSLVKEAIWAWKTLFSFLFEQPSQLKYIEWPGFQSTLKTSTLTLVLVAIFIVVLSSVDSALCFVLALLLRTP